MSKFLKTLIKATVKNLIVAFIYVIFIIGTIFIFFKEPITNISSTIDFISESNVKKVQSDVKIDIEKQVMISYPDLGSRYGTFKINSLNINLPIYYGDTLEILKYGMGHSASSYFPGEGGTIIYMAHNTENMLRNLPNIKIGDEIDVETSYGNYKYTVYETKIVKDTDYDELKINKDEEKLIVYTCYPTTTITYTEYRYLVLARRA